MLEVLKLRSAAVPARSPRLPSSSPVLKSVQHTSIRPFSEGDASALAGLLSQASEAYTRFFHPFAFETEVIENLTANSVIDQWFILEISEVKVTWPVGFYMLRGMDEGFADPMYGVFIAESHAGRGLARLTLAHAESQCRLNGWKNIRLKVDPANARAHQLYLACGFEFEAEDPKNSDQIILIRQVSK